MKLNSNCRYSNFELATKDRAIVYIYVVTDLQNSNTLSFDISVVIWLCL